MVTIYAIVHLNKILIKSSTFTIDYEYYLRHVCAHTIIGKNVVCQAQIKRKRETSFSLVILYLRIKKIVRGIVWVSWVASFVMDSTDYSKLKASRRDTFFVILFNLSTDSRGRSVFV